MSPTKNETPRDGSARSSSGARVESKDGRSRGSTSNNQDSTQEQILSGDRIVS